MANNPSQLIYPHKTDHTDTSHVDPSNSVIFMFLILALLLMGGMFFVHYHKAHSSPSDVNLAANSGSANSNGATQGAAAQ